MIVAARQGFARKRFPLLVPDSPLLDCSVETLAEVLVLRHLPELVQVLLHSLSRIDEKGSGEVLGLPLERAAQARVVTCPQMIAGM